MNFINNAITKISSTVKFVALITRVTWAVWGVYAKANKAVIPAFIASLLVWVGYIYGSFVIGGEVSSMIGTGFLATLGGFTAGLAVYVTMVTIHKLACRPMMNKARAWFAANPECMIDQFKHIEAITTITK